MGNQKVAQISVTDKMASGNIKNNFENAQVQLYPYIRKPQVRTCSQLVQTYRNLLRSCQSFGLRHEDLVRPKNIFPVRKKSPKKFTVMCMFCLAFLECFTLVLAIGHLISPLVFIEVKSNSIFSFQCCSKLYMLCLL